MGTYASWTGIAGRRGSSRAMQVYRFVAGLSNRKIQLRAKLSYIAASSELPCGGRRLMLIRKPSELGYSQVTPRDVYLNRRRFLGATAGVLAAGCGVPSARAAKLDAAKTSFNADGEKITPLNVATS